MKLKELLNLITKKHILGKLIAKIYVIEYQKRGLPHAHILIFLHEDDKTEFENIDLIISAQIPNPIRFPQLFATVSKCNYFSQFNKM